MIDETQLSWHDYQLSLSHEIKWLRNNRMKLSIERCFMQVLFHFISHISFENVIKLTTKTSLR